MMNSKPECGETMEGGMTFEYGNEGAYISARRADGGSIVISRDRISRLRKKGLDFDVIA